MSTVVGIVDDFRSFNGQRPDLSKADPAELLRDGLATVLERSEACLKDCDIEARMGDFKRHNAEQHRKAMAERNVKRKADRFTDEQHATITEGQKVLALTLLYDEAFSLWNIMNDIATCHGLTRPAKWPLDERNKQDIGALADAFRDAHEWATAREAERTGKPKGMKFSKSRSPQEWRRILGKLGWIIEARTWPTLFTQGRLIKGPGSTTKRVSLAISCLPDEYHDHMK